MTPDSAPELMLVLPGQGFGVLVYTRNLWLLRHPRSGGGPLATADERP